MNDREDMALHPSDDGWIEWNGGECPVNAHKKVHIRLRGDLDSERDGFKPMPAQSYSWVHGGPFDPQSDIIAYRIVEQNHD